MKPYYPASQLIINEDGSIFHLHIRPEHLADKEHANRGYLLDFMAHIYMNSLN